MISWGLSQGGRLDTDFLRRYALRMERQAKGTVVWNTFVGGLIGYVFGSMVMFIHYLFAKVVMVQQMMLMWKIPLPQTGPSLGDYTAIAIAVAFAVIWGLRGMGKADEMRFQAQLALHVLEVYEMERVVQEKIRG